MGNLTRYRSADLPELMERISRNSIGLDDYFNKFFDLQTPSNYPPYNLVHVNNVESRLEIALAGFTKEEVNVYTEYGKLFVTGQKDEKDDANYVHKGLAQRSFERAWSLSDDVEIKSANFENGLLVVELGKIIPEHHARKDWL
jgi:HSP20 family molecular chaperone IbpA|tara:strand:- start:1403 stop:1831 length:429 start_codon:yes stop_codon:yes gene_type:complete